MQEESVEKTKYKSEVPSPVIFGIAGSILVLVGGASYWGWDLLVSSNTFLDQIVFPTARLEKSSGERMSDSVLVYWLSGETGALEMVSRPVTVESSAHPQDMIEGALRRLLAGINNEEVSSTIPPGTKLNSVRLGPEGIFVDLSPEFAQEGERESLTLRLGQILYTATSLNPESQVWFEVDGQALEEIGNEKIAIEQPLTRERFQTNFNLGNIAPSEAD